ncbi:MAG: hypothetical protein WCV56_06385 [Candidatus Omnitrophota bacterium]
METRLKNFFDEYNRIVFSEKDTAVSSRSFLARSAEGIIPRKTVIDGKWSLTDEYDLKLSVSASDSAYFGRTIILKGDILAASSSGLIFRIRHCDALSGTRYGTVELKGVWAADSKNRISFRVAKADGRYDVLTFQGIWNIGSNNELSYKMVTTELKTKTKKEKTLVFRGHWDLYRTRIVYSLEGTDTSFFSFKAAVQTKSIMAKQGEIRYQLGMGVSSRRDKGGKSSRTVTIYGIWKFSRDLKVSFEIKGPATEKREIIFGIDKVFAENRNITVSLKDKKGEKMGMDVTFSKVFAKDAEFFVSVGSNVSEIRILGGLRLRF